MKKKQAGFTVVELLVTVLVGAIFISMFYQLYTTLIQLNANARRDASAGDLAFSNLGRYTTRASTGVTCPGGSPTTPLLRTSTNSNYSELGNITEKITISCSGSGDTILILSEVTYKNGVNKATYATYVN